MTSKTTIGLVELSGLAAGYEVEDRVLKSARVEKLVGRSICSGKYLLVVRGEFADVESGLETARRTGGAAVIQAVAVPRVDEGILPALSGCTAADGRAAEGLLVLETFSAASAVKLADVAAKAAGVAVLRIHLAMAIGGKGLVILAGDTETLKAARGPVLDWARDDGLLGGVALIPNPHPDLLRELL
jgi:microcompartment protein CcmL/EutN